MSGPKKGLKADDMPPGRCSECGRKIKPSEKRLTALERSRGIIIRDGEKGTFTRRGNWAPMR